MNKDLVNLIYSFEEKGFVSLKIGWTYYKRFKMNFCESENLYLVIIKKGAEWSDGYVKIQIDDYLENFPDEMRRALLFNIDLIDPEEIFILKIF